MYARFLQKAKYFHLKSGYKVLSIPIKICIIVKINHFIFSFDNCWDIFKDKWLNNYTSIKNNMYIIVRDRHAPPIFFLLVIGWKMYKSCKTKFRFGICISTGVRQLKFISLSLFECSFHVFFSRFSNSGSSHTDWEPRSLSKQCMQSQCPAKTERHIFRSQSHIGWSTHIWEGGGLLQPLLTNLSAIMISVSKAGLGATLKRLKMTLFG